MCDGGCSCVSLHICGGGVAIILLFMLPCVFCNCNTSLSCGQSCVAVGWCVGCSSFQGESQHVHCVCGGEVVVLLAAVPSALLFFVLTVSLFKQLVKWAWKKKSPSPFSPNYSVTPCIPGEETSVGTDSSGCVYRQLYVVLYYQLGTQLCLRPSGG